MKVGVLGAGAIGCYVGGRLLAASAAEVVLVGRPKQRDELAAHGLVTQDFDGPRAVVPPARVTFATEVDALAGCDVILCCVKSQHTDAAARELARVVGPDAVIVSLQNGVRNADMLRAQLPTQRVIPSIVSWNVIAVGDCFRRTTSGPLVLERHDATRALVAALSAAGIPVEEHAVLAPHQWTKLLVNLNNAVSALTDVATGRLLLEPGYRRIVAALADEGLAVLRAADIKTARFNGVPLRWMPTILRLPTFLVRLVTRAQLKVDPAARSSMWQDLAAGRPTEGDYLNGELVPLAERSGTDAPINRRIVALVHDAERAGAGSPRLSADALWTALTG